MADFTKVHLLTLRDNRVLLCRKLGLDLLVTPGGGLERGESPMECLVRELHEELGEVTLVNPEYVATYTIELMSDPGKTADYMLYRGDLIGDPVASSEITEVVWFGPPSSLDELVPNLAKIVFPDLIDRGLLPWDR